MKGYLKLQFYEVNPKICLKSIAKILRILQRSLISVYFSNLSNFYTNDGFVNNKK